MSRTITNPTTTTTTTDDAATLANVQASAAPHTPETVPSKPRTRRAEYDRMTGAATLNMALDNAAALRRAVKLAHKTVDATTLASIAERVAGNRRKLAKRIVINGVPATVSVKNGNAWITEDRDGNRLDAPALVRTDAFTARMDRKAASYKERVKDVEDTLNSLTF